jgi:hypothetical protein
MADSVLGANLGNALRECASKPLQGCPGGPSELGGLPPKASPGLPAFLSQGEEDQDAGRGLKHSAPAVKFSGMVIALEVRTRGKALGHTRVLSQPDPHYIENPDRSVPLLTIAKFRIELEKTGCGIYSLERPGVKSGFEGVLSGWHRVSYRGIDQR